MSNPSIVHTFGNVACVAVDYMESFFGPDFFNKIHVSTKLSHRQLDVFRAKTGFWKNKKPMLVLRPRVDWEGNGNWFYGSTMMTRLANGRTHMEFADRVKLIHDPEHRLDVDFIWNRYKIIYDVVIVLETYNQQANIMHDLRNQLGIENYYPLQTILEAYIPKSVVYSIADYLHIDRNDTASILEYMNTVSEVPITYKLHKSSGNTEFFMMYPTRIEVFPSDLQPDDGTTKGMVTDTYTIGLSLSMEFNSVGVWYTFLFDSDDTFRKAPMDENLMNSEDRVILMSSIPLGYDLGLEKGWKIIESPFYFATPDPKTGIDETDISEILNKISIRNLINHHKQMNIPLEYFLQFRVFRGNKELPRGIKGFDIDLEQKKLYTYNAFNQDSHRLFVIINTMAINNMATEISNFDKK